MDVPVVIKCERAVRRSSKSSSIHGRRNSTGPGIVEAKSKRRPSDGSASNRRPSATRSDTFRSLQNFLSEGPVPQDGSDSTRSRKSPNNSSNKATPRTSVTSVIIGDEFDGLDMTPSVLEESLRVAAKGDSKLAPNPARRHSHHGSGRSERSHSFDDYFVPTNLTKTKAPLDGEHSCSHSADEISDIIADYYEEGNEDGEPSLAFMSESFRLAKAAVSTTATNNNKVRRGSRDNSSSRAPAPASNRRRSYHGAERRGSLTLRPGVSRRSSDPGMASSSDIFGGILGTFTGRLAEELNVPPSQDDNKSDVQDEDDDPSMSKCTGDDSTALHDIIEGLEEAAEAGRSSIQVLTSENRMLKEANKQLVLDMEQQDEARREEIASLKAELKAMNKRTISLSKVSEAKDKAVEKLTKDLEKRDATISALQDVVTTLRKKIGY